MSFGTLSQGDEEGRRAVEGRGGEGRGVKIGQCEGSDEVETKDEEG